MTEKAFPVKLLNCDKRLEKISNKILELQNDVAKKKLTADNSLVFGSNGIVEITMKIKREVNGNLIVTDCQAAVGKHFNVSLFEHFEVENN